jgi:hypothetical protein
MNETVYQLPQTWPFGPYLHAVVMVHDGKQISTMLNVSATDRQGDSDFIIPLIGNAGSFLIPGNAGVAYQGKVYGIGDIESYTIQIKVSTDTPVNPLHK